jgi:hypothetical protein
VSACESSLIPSAIGHPGRLAAMAAMAPQGLLEALGAVADPSKRRGVRHGFVSILALCACAVLAGARSFVAIAERALDLTPLLRGRLGIGRVPPCESTIRRVLQRVDLASSVQSIDVAIWSTPGQNTCPLTELVPASIAEMSVTARWQANLIGRRTPSFGAPYVHQHLLSLAPSFTVILPSQVVLTANNSAVGRGTTDKSPQERGTGSR